MRRPTMFLAVLGLALTLGAGTARAVEQHCAAGVQCEGTDEDDTLKGDAGANTVYGFGGADTITGGDGADVLHGDARPDGALDGADKVSGGAGNDLLTGAGRADVLLGGPGNDLILAEEGAENGRPGGRDTVKGGDGQDIIEAVDGFKDVIDCGRGRDKVRYDRGIDTVENCEEKTPR